MIKKLVFVILITIFACSGCAGTSKQLYMMEDTGDTRSIDFPAGTASGEASTEQAIRLAQIFVDSHNIAMREIQNLKSACKRPLENDEALQSSIQRQEMNAQQNFETADDALGQIVRLSKQQGTGEITLFYPCGVTTLKKNSLEFERLVRFLDYLSRESRGRGIIFISIGSASSIGNAEINAKLAQNRAEYPKDIIEKYLINIPHEFFKVYGIGDIYSPKDVSGKEHERYQHTRLIAIYDLNQIPILPKVPDIESGPFPAESDQDDIAKELSEQEAAEAPEIKPELNEFPDQEFAPEYIEEKPTAELDEESLDEEPFYEESLDEELFYEDSLAEPAPGGGQL
ncbi:MAG: hypothetical protein ACMUJM_15640 [bacterium]